MKSVDSVIEQYPESRFSHSIVGITSPEFLEFVRASINSIAKGTKTSAKALGATTLKIVGWIGRKFQEGCEIHVRNSQALDEHYVRNFYCWHGLI